MVKLKVVQMSGKEESSHMVCDGCNECFNVVRYYSNWDSINYCPICGERIEERITLVAGGGGGIGSPKEITTYQVPKDKSGE